MPPERSQISQRPELVANSIPLPGADFFLGLKWRNQGNMNLKEKHFTLVYWKNSCVQQPQKDIAHGLNFFSVAKAHCQINVCIYAYICTYMRIHWRYERYTEHFHNLHHFDETESLSFFTDHFLDFISNFPSTPLHPG